MKNAFLTLLDPLPVDSVHIKGHTYFRWVVLLVAKRRVAVGTIQSGTMLCFLKAHGTASPDRG